MAIRFRFFFDAAFFISCIQLVTGMVGLYLGGIENRLKTIMVYVFWLCNIALILLWIYVFFVRYSHSG